MKLSYLWIAAIVLPFAACKKEKQFTSTTDQVQEQDYTICTQEKWTTNITSENLSYNIFFVVNDKFYSVRNVDGDVPGDDVIFIYDGSSWTTIDSDIPMGTNHNNFSFSIGSKGYAATCFNNSPNRFYQYNPVTNNWIRKADFPGEAVTGFATFTINDKGYVVGGYNTYTNKYTNKLWEYNPATNSWRERKNLFLNRAYATGFSIGSKGYITNGIFPADLGYYHSLVEYDPVANTWTEKADFPGMGRASSESFVIDNYGYVGGGLDNSDALADFYKYNPASNAWTRVTSLLLAGISTDVGFSINSKGYIGYGTPANTRKLAKYSPPVCSTINTPGPVINN